jgi:hypothetical protein
LSADLGLEKVEGLVVLAMEDSVGNVVGGRGILPVTHEGSQVFRQLVLVPEDVGLGMSLGLEGLSQLEPVVNRGGLVEGLDVTGQVGERGQALVPPVLNSSVGRSGYTLYRWPPPKG